MDDIVGVFLSWQFLLVGIVVYFTFKLFNDFLAPKLWRAAKMRRVLKYFEGSKMVFPPLLGFALGWVPQMPRPEPLAESNSLTVAMLFMVAGLFCQAIVKGIRKALSARGINIELDMTPKEQKTKMIQ